jgi:hypothetical protein
VDITELSKEEALRQFEERVVLAAQAAHPGCGDGCDQRALDVDSARALFQFDSEIRRTTMPFKIAFTLRIVLRDPP